MAITNVFKKNKLIWALLILAGVLAIFAYCVLYNSGVELKKTATTEVIGKLANIQKNGGEFELTQKNIDELSNIYFAKAKTKGNITLKGVNVEILNDELLIKAPIRYKKLNLLLTSKGKLNFINGKVTYDADNFKIGIVTLPKKIIISQILKLNNKNFYVEGNLIKINETLFPFTINSLKIKENEILAVASAQGIKASFEDLDKMSEQEIDKQLDALKQKIQMATVLMDEEVEKAKVKEINDIVEGAKGKSIVEKKEIISDSINKIDEVISETTDSEKKKELEKIRLEAEKAQKAAEEKENISKQQNETRRVALIKAQGDLSGAYSQVGSSKGKQIISIMSSSMGAMASDPAYNSSSNQATVKSLYSTLDSASKNEFKSALITNVDQDNLSLLRQIFGI